jgi:N6-L-threonylcarbamoyladenine synthase
MPTGSTASSSSPRPAATRVLGIETSCDETAAALVLRRPDGKGEILANVVRSQWEQHRGYGGVVPEIAARAHLDCLDAIVAEAMRAAGLGFQELDAVAVTAGPGLIGGLLVGAMTAKAIAAVHGLPLVAVNHLEAHALTVGLTESLPPPYLLLLVSGGHTQSLFVHDIGSYRRLGSTIDDALGEAFDKTAKLLGLGFPGGPAVERAAASGRPGRFQLPRPMLGRPEAHFSFAGLKTAVRHQAQALAPLRDDDIADLCAEFQAAVTESVVDRIKRAMALAADLFEADATRHLVVAGGVAANACLNAALARTAVTAGYRLHVPPPALCTDNAAMVAWAGAERLARGLSDGLEFEVRARWPLDPNAPPALGAGKQGAKA